MVSLLGSQSKTAVLIEKNTFLASLLGCQSKNVEFHVEKRGEEMRRDVKRRDDERIA